MKKLIAIAVLSAATSLGVFAQGNINFANGAAGVNSPNKNIDNTTLLAGNGYLADFFYGAVGSTAAQLTDAGVAVAFGTGVNSGYFFGPSIGNLGSSQIAFQVRIWQASAGATWAAATGGASTTATAGTYAGNGGTAWGFSGIFTVTPTVSPTTPANLTQLTSFNLVPVPEPTTIALGGLGAAALLLFRRRK